MAYKIPRTIQSVQHCGNWSCATANVSTSITITGDVTIDVLDVNTDNFVSMYIPRTQAQELIRTLQAEVRQSA